MIQRLVLDGWQPTSLNRLLRMDKHSRQKALNCDAWVIGCEAKVQGLTKATGRRRVSLVIRHAKGKAVVDPDALYKSLLDGLRKCGLLKDDNRHWLELGPVTYEAAPKRGLVVVLEEPCLF